MFSIVANSGALSFAAAPNFEAPGCGAGNNANTCVVVLSVTDGANSDTITVTVTVTDVEIAITGSQTASIAENTGTGNAIMTVATTGDSMAGNSWAITGGNGGGQFAIAAATGVISTTGTALDYDSATSHSLTVAVNDGTGAAVTNTVVISVTDLNDQTPTFNPTAGAINYAEGASTAVDSFTITDTDTTGTFACAEAGADASKFSCAISGSTLTVSWDASPDFETQTDADSNGIYVYTITVGDGTNDASAVTYTITVTNVNEAPTVANAISDASTNEDAAYSLDVSSVFTDVDSGDSCTYTMSGHPNTLSISNSGTISGTPTNANVAAHTIQLHAPMAQVHL